MTTLAFAVFETPIGRGALAWGDRGVVGVQLPEATDGRTRLRMGRRFADIGEATPPAQARHAIDGIVALLSGQPIDLADVAIDLGSVGEFDRRVYEVTRRIPPGRTLTYGALAAQLGDAQLARAVGQALGCNPLAIIVPCHRVLAANGQLGGFSASAGAIAKRRLLLIEGARIGGGPGLFDNLPSA